MQTPNIRRIFLAAGIASLLVAYLGIWLRFINDPMERTGSDFIAFYSAGRVAQNEGLAKVYNIELQQQIQQEEVGFQLAPGQVLLYNHLPFLVPVLQLLVNTNYVTSFYRWVFLLLLLYVLGIVILGMILRKKGVDRASDLITATGGILFLPVFFSLMNGQDTAFLFLALSMWLYGLASGKTFAGGLGLSLATVRPHIALTLAIPMLFYSRRVFSGFLLGSLVLAVCSFLVLGISGTREFIHVLLLSAGGEWYGMKEETMYNLIGLLTRAFPHLETAMIRLLGWIVYALTIALLSIVWFKGSLRREELLMLTVTLALFVAPHLHFHDLALLLFPIYEMIGQNRENGNVRASISTSIPVALSLVLLVSNIATFLQYTVPYLIMLALVAFPITKNMPRR